MLDWVTERLLKDFLFKNLIYRRNYELPAANYSDKPWTILKKISISVELHKWNTKIKIEYIYKKEFDEKFGKINIIQISTVSSCFTFSIPQGIALKAFLLLMSGRYFCFHSIR